MVGGAQLTAASSWVSNNGHLDLTWWDLIRHCITKHYLSQVQIVKRGVKIDG